MKIGNITEEGRGGGPLFGMVTSALDLSEVGVKTTLLFPKQYSEGFKKKLDNLNLDYYQLSLSHLTRHIPHLLRYLLLFIPEVILLTLHLRKQRYDLLLCNGSWQVKGVLAAKLSGTPSLWHMNDSQMPKAIHLLFKIFSRLPNGFMFASQKSKDYYSSLNPLILEKVNMVIQSPIDIEKFAGAEPGKTELPQVDGVKVITVSYLNANKNVELIIKAIGRLKETQESPLHLYVVGPVLESQVDYKEKVDKIISDLGLDTIHFLGYRSDIPELLSDADVYVCSSNFESSPIAVWEAMVNGTMVITTDVGDVRQIIKDNNAGIVIETNAVDQLAESLLIASDSKQNAKYAEKGQMIANKLFDSKGIAKEIFKLSQLVIANK